MLITLMNLTAGEEPPPPWAHPPPPPPWAHPPPPDCHPNEKKMIKHILSIKQTTHMQIKSTFDTRNG